MHYFILVVSHSLQNSPDRQENNSNGIEKKMVERETKTLRERDKWLVRFIHSKLCLPAMAAQSAKLSAPSHSPILLPGSGPLPRHPNLIKHLMFGYYYTLAIRSLIRHCPTLLICLLVLNYSQKLHFVYWYSKYFFTHRCEFIFTFSIKILYI